MIEIIKRGTKHIAVCTECGCKFSYEDEDVINENRNECACDIYNMSKAYIAYINCPQCDKKVIIKQSKPILSETQSKFLRSDNAWPEIDK